MNKILNTILYLLLGEWNGVQNFIAPALLLFLFNQYSFIKWMTSTLTFQRYFLPLSVYIVILFSIILMCIKVLLHWHRDHGKYKQKESVNVYRDLLVPYILKLHKWLLAFLTIFIIVYIIKSGFTFIYRAQFPIFIVYYWLLRIGGIAVTLYTINLLEIAIPHIKRGKSLNWAQNYMHKIVIKRWRSSAPILFVQLIWIYVSVLFFNLVISQIQNLNETGFFQINHKPFELSFANVHNVPQFLSNLAICIGAFMLSNLLYSPLMLLVSKGLHRFKLTIKSL